MALLINGKTAVHRASGGVCRTEDLCYTGEDNHIICYTNIALSQDADNTAKTVFHNNFAVCHIKSTFSKSSGDEPGNAGVHSGTLQGKAEFISGSDNVFIEGEKAVRAGDSMVSNNRNTSAGVLVQ